MHQQHPSEPQSPTRPKFAGWVAARGLKPGFVARQLGVGREQVRRYCLPFGDPMRAVPREAVMAIVREMTGGEVTSADWHPPELDRVSVPATLAEAHP